MRDQEVLFSEPGEAEPFTTARNHTTEVESECLSMDMYVEPKPAAMLPSVTQSNPTLSIIEKAIDRGVGAEELGALIDLQRGIAKDLSKVEFEKAMVQFQSICPPIVKTGDADGRYKFPKFPIIMDTIRPLLHRCGLSVRFKRTPAGSEGWVATTCIVSHEAGHSEESYFDAPIDQTKSSAGKSLMNSTQQIGSANQYCKRYALADALNLSFYDDSDDDAASMSVVEKLPMEEAAKYREIIESMDDASDAEQYFCNFICSVDSFDDVPVSFVKKIESVIADQKKAAAK